MMDTLRGMIGFSLASSVSLIYPALGEVITEKAGVLNISLDGVMMLGAFTAFIVAANTGKAGLGVLAALGLGLLLGFFHAVSTVTLRANQVVVGLAMVILGTGLSNLLGQAYVGQVGIKITKVLGQDIFVWVMFPLTVLVWLVLSKTRLGLSLKSVGESPQVADAAGINVIAYRYLATVLGGALVSLGGAHLSLAYTPGWAFWITAGRGWIAYALVMFSGWDPLWVLPCGIFFGAASIGQFVVQALGLPLPAALLGMTPYFLTIVAVAATRKRRQRMAPLGLGRPWQRE